MRFINKRVKVWFLTGSLPPHFSGAGKNDYLIAPHCVKNGLDVTFLAPKYSDQGENDYNGIINYGLPVPGKYSSRILISFRVLQLLRSKPHPDIIRMRGYAFSRSIVTKMVKYLYPHIKIVVQPAMYGGDDPVSIQKKRFGFFVKDELLKSDAIFAMNSNMMNVFKIYNYPIERLYEVQNPVDTEKYKPVSYEEKLKIRKNLNLPENDLIIATMGILSKRKNQSFVTKAFNKAYQNENGKNLSLVHIGPTSKDLKSLGRFEANDDAIEEEVRIRLSLNNCDSAKKVHLVGYQKDPEIYLKAVDFFVHASTEEGESNVINEALSCGLPCIIPYTDVYSRQVLDSCGLRFRSNNKISLCEQILKIISNKKLIFEMGNSGRMHIMATRSPLIVAKRYSSNLRKVASFPPNLK